MPYLYLLIFIILLLGVEVGFILPFLHAPYTINLLFLLMVIFIYEEYDFLWPVVLLTAFFTEMRSSLAPGTYFSAYVLLATLVPLAFSRILVISRPLGYLIFVTIGSIIFVDLWVFLVSTIVNWTGLSHIPLSFKTIMYTLPVRVVLYSVALYPLYTLVFFFRKLIKK